MIRTLQIQILPRFRFCTACGGQTERKAGSLLRRGVFEPVLTHVVIEIASRRWPDWALRIKSLDSSHSSLSLSPQLLARWIRLPGEGFEKRRACQAIFPH